MYGKRVGKVEKTSLLMEISSGVFRLFIGRFFKCIQMFL